MGAGPPSLGLLFSEYRKYTGGTASNRPVPHDHVEVAFVLIRAFNGRGLLDVLPMKGIVGHGRLASEKFRRGMRYRGAGKHGSLLVPRLRVINRQVKRRGLEASQFRTCDELTRSTRNRSAAVIASPDRERAARVDLLSRPARMIGQRRARASALPACRLDRREYAGLRYGRRIRTRHRHQASLR